MILLENLNELPVSSILLLAKKLSEIFKTADNNLSSRFRLWIIYEVTSTRYTKIEFPEGKERILK
jgi:hypothetical protein